MKVVVVDGMGSRAEASIPVRVGSAFVITTPKDGDQVGPGTQRAIVTVTVGINGTLPPGVNVSRVVIYINGQPWGMPRVARLAMVPRFTSIPGIPPSLFRAMTLLFPEIG